MARSEEIAAPSIAEVRPDIGNGFQWRSVLRVLITLLRNCHLLGTIQKLGPDQ